MWARLSDRLAGLDDLEWAWLPTSDDRTGLHWRLNHLATVQSEHRNTTSLGVGTSSPMPPALSVAAALAGLDVAYAQYRVLLTDIDHRRRPLVRDLHSRRRSVSR